MFLYLNLGMHKVSILAIQLDTTEAWDYHRTSTPKEHRTLSVFEHSSDRAAGRRPKTKTVDTSTSDIDQKAPLNFGDPCIWNTREIDVLRRVFQSAQKQNINLKARLQGSEEELEKLKKKHKALTITQGSNSGNIQSAVKANQRIQLLSQNLKVQLDKANRDIQLLEKELGELKDSKRESLKELRDTRVLLDSERLEKKRLEIDLQNQNKEVLREWHLREDNLKLLHQEDIGYLRKQNTKISRQLEQEKKDHHRTQKALEHLRLHFANLPLAGEDKPRAVVTSDQLKKWTY